MRIGLVGLGRMGGAMRQRLAETGAEVVAYDIAPGHGGVARLEEVAAPLVLLSLPDGKAVGAALAGLLPALPAGAVIADTSTISPLEARDFAARVAAAGHAYLDAPVSGGPAGAAAGTLTVMLGGDAAALERARPGLERIAARILHVGDSGAGQVAKLVNNLLVATHLVVAGEALRIGTAAGVPAEALLAVVNAASGRSAATEVNLPRWVLSGSFDSGFTAGLMRKDARLALELARAVGAEPSACGAAVAAWETPALPDDADFNRIAALLMQEERA
ncbi:3-hydroxyisobutyrate dehydrogenase [Falsiroseomonas bella]|uniref:3-hydroxyisobutyrate dehydrogenase n=1 Tax=Falsiroseomonas bella TaxID=2184016 RepID=A0A317FC41_9PROT|nr:NAD(P)-dependent oxidoreductase [Falsiroseomonas bella]PWS36670.1 3-hydroxyisobutyrate dehydrogenase [Falsiroseomonas bella]